MPLSRQPSCYPRTNCGGANDPQAEMKHQPLLNGLVYLVRITPQRGSGVLGCLQDKKTGEIVFESELPSYKDAYWALMEMDSEAWVS